MILMEERKDFIRDLFALAIPVGIQNLISHGVILLDNIMIGSLGEDCISAVSIC